MKKPQYEPMKPCLSWRDARISVAWLEEFITGDSETRPCNSEEGKSGLVKCFQGLNRYSRWMFGLSWNWNGSFSDRFGEEDVHQWDKVHDVFKKCCVAVLAISEVAEASLYELKSRLIKAERLNRALQIQNEELKEEIKFNERMVLDV